MTNGISLILTLGTANKDTEKKKLNLQDHKEQWTRDPVSKPRKRNDGKSKSSPTPRAEILIGSVH